MGIFTEYLKKGYQPLPIGYLTKYPCVYENGKWKGFSRLGKLKDSPVTEVDTTIWDTWTDYGAGVGIALGEHSGVVALDFDSDDEYTDKIKALLPKPPVMKRGKKGLTAFFKYNGEKNKKWRAGGDEYALELLSTGNQTVIPPSYHPSTREPYIWLNENTLLNFPKGELPSLPEGFVEQVTAIVNPEPVHVPQQTSLEYHNEKPEASDIAEALDFISPDCPYDEWLNIGMSIKDELGDAGFFIWDSWSRKSSKYPKKGEPTTSQKWKSFTNSGITINTLFKQARLEGYNPEPKIEHVEYNLPFIERLKLEPAAEGAKERIEDGFPIHLCKAPGLVGDIQEWIEKSAMFPQPVLALGAAISVVGALYAHKVEGSTKSRTNMYCLGVAPSGSGKEHPRKCVELLLNKTENQHLIGGDPASSTGLLKSMSNGNGRRIIQMDEFGRVLKGMTSRNASSHIAGLPTIMMKLFSSASGTYYGTEYANHDGKMERKDIEQPCLCIHASTVPEHLFQAMTGTDAIDGFLSRWLIFENKGYPDMQEPKMDANAVPPHIIDKVLEWSDESTRPTGNLAFNVIAPKIVPFTPRAKVIAEDFAKSMRRRAQEKQAKGDNTYAIWTRTFEHATKLALVAHDNGVVDEDVMKWALEVSTYCSQFICDQATAHIADNEYEKTLKTILRIIKEAKSDGITKTNLLKRTQGVTSRERNDILTSLIESDQVFVKQKEGKTKPTNVYVFNKN